MVLFSETAVSLVLSQALSFSTNGFVSACRTTRRSSALRPRIHDPFQCLVGDRRRTAFVDIEEVAPPVRPAESERHHRASITPRISQLFVDRIAVPALTLAGSEMCCAPRRRPHDCGSGGLVATCPVD
jgi:hypothetical protein